MAMYFASLPRSLTGQQILERSAKAYGKVRSFDETIKGSLDGQIGTAHISFLLPEKLVVTGTSIQNTRYALFSNGSMTVWWRNPRRVERAVTSSGMGFAAISPISAYAASVVPYALRRMSFFGEPLNGLLSEHGKVPASLKVITTTLRGRRVYFLKGGDSAAWIDAQTFFLARTYTKLKTGSFPNHHYAVVDFDPPRIDVALPADTFSMARISGFLGQRTAAVRHR